MTPNCRSSGRLKCWASAEAGHANLLLPHIGRMPLRDVCNDALEAFKKQHVADGMKASAINHSLEVVRTVLNRAARV